MEFSTTQRYTLSSYISGQLLSMGYRLVSNTDVVSIIELSVSYNYRLQGFHVDLLTLVIVLLIFI